VAALRYYNQGAHEASALKIRCNLSSCIGCASQRSERSRKAARLSIEVAAAANSAHRAAWFRHSLGSPGTPIIADV
jgi:hypothetical protein